MTGLDGFTVGVGAVGVVGVIGGFTVGGGGTTGTVGRVTVVVGGTGNAGFVSARTPVGSSTFTVVEDFKYIHVLAP